MATAELAVVEKRNADWRTIAKLARLRLRDKGELPPVYAARLEFELKQVEVQGSNAAWVDYFNDRKQFNSNPNRLLLPWLLGMIKQDPVAELDEERDGPYLTAADYKTVTAVVNQTGKLPSDIYQDSDKPDIDLDCLPEAREPIKKYAQERYGQGQRVDEGGEEYGFVCSVGTWQTYLLRSAIIDVWKAMACGNKDVVLAMTTQLPDEVDELKDGGKSACKNRVPPPGGGEPKECGTVHDQVRCPQCDSDSTESPTLARLLQDHEVLRKFADEHPEELRLAVGLVGRIKTMGKHAGALIIADRQLYGNLPLARKTGKDKFTGEPVTHWLSMWTEGRKTELSKFGYNKWDILGLKNLKYIATCCKLIEENRGIRFGDRLQGWDTIDPEAKIAGWYEKYNVNTGEWDRNDIPLNDPEALALADQQKTDAVFQFDTDLAKRILSNGVENFEDLMLFNAMGHPGPMDSIPEAVANRADVAGTWRSKLHPEILEVLKDTYGVIVYQEQLQTLWQRIAGFTAPEAQEARKAVAKKWKHLLKPIRQKWIDGAKRKLGEQAAKEWWDKMETFGRYAFNRSHAVAYCLVAYRCLWLKAHFPQEWWAAVMSDCHPDKLVRYRGVARSEGADFATLNIDKLTINFTVTGSKVNQGLIGLKKVGSAAAKAFEHSQDREDADTGRPVLSFEDFDQFVRCHPKNKTVLERLIKLGAFGHLPGHENRYALWNWYLYRYGSGKEATEIKRVVRTRLMEAGDWDDQKIADERARRIHEYKCRYPKRNKTPDSMLNWTPKLDGDREEVMALFPFDYTTPELLTFEKEYLGYYMSNPLERYEFSRQFDIKKAKKETVGPVHAVIMRVEFGQTKKGDEMCRVNLYDGNQMVLLLLWSDDCERYRSILEKAEAALTREIKPRGEAGQPAEKQSPKHEVGVGVNVRYSAGKGQTIKSFTLLRKSQSMWLLPPTRIRPTDVPSRP